MSLKANLCESDRLVFSRITILIAVPFLLKNKKTIFPLKTDIYELCHHKEELISIMEPFAQE